MNVAMTNNDVDERARVRASCFRTRSPACPLARQSLLLATVGGEWTCKRASKRASEPASEVHTRALASLSSTHNFYATAAAAPRIISANRSSANVDDDARARARCAEPRLVAGDDSGDDGSGGSGGD